MDIRKFIELIEQQRKEQDSIYHNVAVKYGLSDTAMWVLYNIYVAKDVIIASFVLAALNLPIFTNGQQVLQESKAANGTKDNINGESGKNARDENWQGGDGGDAYNYTDEDEFVDAADEDKEDSCFSGSCNDDNDRLYSLRR